MEHKKDESKVCESECKKVCKKNSTCLKGHCGCVKKLAKVLVFIMLVIITFSVAKIAFSVNQMHEGFGIQTGMQRIYR